MVMYCMLLGSGRNKKVTMTTTIVGFESKAERAGTINTQQEERDVIKIPIHVLEDEESGVSVGR